MPAPTSTELWQERGRGSEPAAMQMTGTISLHPRGFGFLTNDERSAFVAPPELNRFLEGDVASAQVEENSPGKFSATGLELQRRWRHELFGTVVLRGKRTYLKVDRSVSNTDWPLSGGRGLRAGDTVIASLENEELVDPVLVAENSSLERCLVRHGIRRHFPDMKWKAPSDDLSRTDLREIPTVTIDAPTTKDIDDALSALPAEEDGSLRILVSIADVDASVRAGTDLDQEAKLRGTSVYLADRVVPMLPDQLSNDQVSLLPGVERKTLTAELRIDTEGNITSTDVYPSLIRSWARLSYEAVSDYLVYADNHDEVPQEVGPTLRRLRTAAARLSAVRAARGGVEMAREEAYVSFDPNTRLPNIEPRKDTIAHQLVERLMVAANEAVAKWLVDRGLPGVYRVHDEPGAEQVGQLSEAAQNFGIEAALGKRLTPRGLSAFEMQFRGTSVAGALRTVLGWALGPARYTVNPGLHFGLGAPLYLHFTSPIRRYADLLVHRIIKAYLGGDRSQKAGDQTLEEICRTLNELNRRASRAENERMRQLIARYFSSRVGEELKGNVVGVKPFGMIVQIQGTGATGVVGLEEFPEDRYRLDPIRQTVYGPDEPYCVGDFVWVQVRGVDEDLGRVELQLNS